VVISSSGEEVRELREKPSLGTRGLPGKRARCYSGRIRDCRRENRLAKITRMNEPNISLAIIWGGRSTEHEVSVCSARNVYDAVDKSKYDVPLILVEKSGAWRLLRSVAELRAAPGFEEAQGSQNSAVSRSEMLQTVAASSVERGFDVAFPLVHDAFGEDGYLQGLLCLLNVPFVGTSVLGSAIGMDKDVMKRLLNQAGIQTPKFYAITRYGVQRPSFSELQDELGQSLFIKPTNTDIRRKPVARKRLSPKGAL
jgi:D-alanine-D-alanine ligase